MKHQTRTNELRAIAEAELINILEWWQTKMVDDFNGGFYGRRDGYGKLYPTADKGIILNTRILWTFSAAARKKGGQNYETMADRSYQYLLEYFWDKNYGGVYWMVDYQGNLVNGRKQIYAQAFAIYAFTEYYQLTQKREALDRAIEIFDLVEQYSLDKSHGGYLEAFGNDWQPIADFRLSVKDANEAKTMNTHLHILEAYTNLYKVYKAEAVKDALQRLIELFINHFIDPETKHLHLFFDENWELKSHEVSYGHDIEAAWLLVKAAKELEEPNLLDHCSKLALEIANVTIQEGLDEDGSLFYEGKGIQITNSNKHWWPQAEGVLGFYYAFKISGDERYLSHAKLIWQFIDTFLKDRNQGEWYWMVDQSGRPILDQEDQAGPWKAPYHNGRMCLELMKA